VLDVIFSAVGFLNLHATLAARLTIMVSRYLSSGLLWRYWRVVCRRLEFFSFSSAVQHVHCTFHPPNSEMRKHVVTQTVLLTTLVHVGDGTVLGPGVGRWVSKRQSVRLNHGFVLLSFNKR
jgi:hypothetical protein